MAGPRLRVWSPWCHATAVPRSRDYGALVFRCRSGFLPAPSRRRNGFGAGKGASASPSRTRGLLLGAPKATAGPTSGSATIPHQHGPDPAAVRRPWLGLSPGAWPHVNPSGASRQLAWDPRGDHLAGVAGSTPQWRSWCSPGIPVRPSRHTSAACRRPRSAHPRVAPRYSRWQVRPGPGGRSCRRL